MRLVATHAAAPGDWVDATLQEERDHWRLALRGELLHYPGDPRDLAVVLSTNLGDEGEVLWFTSRTENYVVDLLTTDRRDSVSELPLVPCGMRLSERHTAMLERLAERARSLQ